MDTRFDAELIAEACERLQEVKNRVLAHHGIHAPMGATVLDELGWDVPSVDGLTLDEMENVWTAASEHGLVDDKTKHMMSFMDGLLLGAICCDMSWEHSFGLEVES